MNFAEQNLSLEKCPQRKDDLIERYKSEANKAKDEARENSNLYGLEELPNHVDQEDLLDKKKQARDKLGSVNLKADDVIDVLIKASSLSLA
jgi:chromosome segregation protein